MALLPPLTILDPYAWERSTVTRLALSELVSAGQLAANEEGRRSGSCPRQGTTRPTEGSDGDQRGGSESEPIKILSKEPGLYPSQTLVTHERWIESHTNRQDQEVMDQPLVLGTIP
jgi:hypothetical protein